MSGPAPGGPRRPRAVPDAPQQDLIAEKNVLASCLTWPDQMPSVDLAPSDFYGGRNALIWETMRQLFARGEPVDTVAVRVELERQKIDSVDHDYLLDICGSTIPIPVQEVEVRQIKRLARRRAMEEEALRLSVASRLGEDVTGVFAKLAEAKDALDSVDQKRAALPSLADVVEAMRFDGRRLLTGIQSFDDMLRGGLPPRRFVSVLGAPGGGKTTFMTALMDGFEQQGASCLYFAADESREGIIVRLGQLAGHPRSAMESPHDSVRRAFAKTLRQRPHLCIVDPRRDRMLLEDAAQRLRAHAEGRIPVLIVDSLQTAPARAVDPEATEYERIEAAANLCEDLAQRYDMLVIAISEMSRASYRSGSKLGDTRPLAGGKGSGRIEYASDLQISLTEVDPQKPGLVDVECSKNRLTGKKPSFRIQLDAERASVREVDAPPDKSPSARAEEKSHLQLEAAKARVKKAIRAHRDLTSQRDVLDVCMGSRSHNATAFRQLERSGVVCVVDGIIRLQEGV